jgi:hypothetical protein
MATRFDRLTQDLKTNKSAGIIPGAGRSLMIDGASIDPLAGSPETIIPAGTPMGQLRGGKWKPIRRTLTDTGETASGWNKILGVVETTMFKVGDVVQLVTVADGSVENLGAITVVTAGTSITVTNGLGSDLVAGEEWVEVTESGGSTPETCCILAETIDMLGPDGVAVDRDGTGHFDGKGWVVDEANLNFNATGEADARLRDALPNIVFVQDQ